jgi:starch-binding outer membrane protein, SusD/RagB family
MFHKCNNKNMRSIKWNAAVLMLVAGLCACKKSFVEQTNPNSVTVERAYTTENDIAGGVYGVYQALRSSNCIGEGASLWTDDRADDLNTTDNQSNNGEPFQFTAFALVASNTYLYSHWSALYAPISRANLVLSFINNVPFANEATKTQYIAEMKFIRAYMYFQLVQEFGDVPVVTERLTTPEQVEALTKRVPRADVYAQIIADLRDVVGSNLPVAQSAANKGRVSLQAANGLLGQVYLRMAVTLGTTPSTTYLNEARNYLLACYNQKTFASLSSITYPSVFDVAQKSSNPEIIWQIVYRQGDPNYFSSIARDNQARGETINSRFQSQGSGTRPTNDLINEFETGDVRTTFSVKYATNPAVQAYFISKFRDTGAATVISGIGGYGGNDWIVLRYADIILNLAEVYLYLGDNGNATTYLNMVRARAGRPDYATMMGDATYSSRYPTLKLAILHERRVELAFEHHRWHDLTRFFNPTDLVNYFKGKSQTNYDNSPLGNITTKDYYFPIPLREYNLNPQAMYQNPGY